MGAEHEVAAKVGGKADRGRALFETNEIIFRGAQRCVVKLDQVRAKAFVQGAWLKLGELELELGPYAAKWLEKIKNPKSVLDKLGVKAGQHAFLVGAFDASFVRDLKARGLTVSEQAPKKGAGLVFFHVATKKQLADVKKHAKTLADDGTLWLLRPKGKDAPVGEMETRAAGLATGLVDVKVVGFSDTLSAEKYVVPLKRRK